MKIAGAGNNHWLAIKNARLEPQPFWGYEDIGAFLLLAVLLGLVLRLLVHLQVLSRSAMDKPSIGFQYAVVSLLGAGFYFILRFGHRQPLLKSRGWVVPQISYIVIALMIGPSFAASIALYLRPRDQSTPFIPLGELLALGLILGAMLEESLFRGSLLPVLASTTGTIPRRSYHRCSVRAFPRVSESSALVVVYCNRSRLRLDSRGFALDHRVRSHAFSLQSHVISLGSMVALGQGHQSRFA